MSNEVLSEVFKLDKYEKFMILVFLVTLPLSNPWVRGDGVGYYAYVRSLLIERHLNFEKDWQHGNDSFVMNRLDKDGQVLAAEYTETGHINNHWSIGPSVLWAPWIIATHLAILICNSLGARIAADGFSNPYLLAMAIATTFYGFLGLWFSYRLAIKYFDRRWAFLGTFGIWWASSLPVYMYFNPSWSHAHSAFACALFLWYWQRTRTERTFVQWIVMGLFSGLMVNVYYPNGAFLLVPLFEGLTAYRKIWKSTVDRLTATAHLLSQHAVYVCVFVIALLPTLISREVIFGNPLRTGYSTEIFNWTSPAFLNVMFSSDHGLVSWTPIIVLSLIGLILFCRRDLSFGLYLLMAFLAFYYVISIQPTWDGMSSFGSRYFVSLTPIFILGLAACFDGLVRLWQPLPARILATCTTLFLIVWNLGLIFQWGTHLIPARGSISWRQASYNQVAVVPEQAAQTLKFYLTRRKLLMRNIEKADVEHIKSGQSAGSARPQ
jgi:hypothetical protein